MVNELGLSPGERELALELFGRGFPPLVHTNCLPFLFGVSPKLIGAMQENPGTYYREFTIRKRSGGRRVIRTPRKFLKLIQRWMGKHVWGGMPSSPAATGFVPGLSIFDHAMRHRGQRHLLTVDIWDFFGSIPETELSRSLGGVGFPTAVVKQLARLSTYAGVLPQGAPTSPPISNVVCHRMDGALSEWARQRASSYSRYADDMTFSADHPFTDEDVAAVQNMVEAAGFRLNVEKTRRRGRDERQEVTGLVVNEKVQPPREVRRRWRATFHRANQHPHEFSDRVDYLRGIRGMVAQYDPNLAREYGEVIDSVEAGSPN